MSERDRQESALSRQGALKTEEWDAHCMMEPYESLLKFLGMEFKFMAVLFVKS